MIGKGGHAEVYKGVLPDGETVAIKKLMSHAKEEEDRVSDFLSELGIIAHVNHPNAARLRGFSSDRGLHFVLEYAPHGSLSTKLFGTENLVSTFFSRQRSLQRSPCLRSFVSLMFCRIRGVSGVEDKV